MASMDDERPHAEKNLGVFLNPSGSMGGGGFVVPMKPLHAGPGEPGPEDEWHVSLEPEGETATGAEGVGDPTSPAAAESDQP